MRVTRVVGAALGRLYRAYYRTLRLRALMADGSVVRPTGFQCDIFALSERDVFALAGIIAGARFTVMVAHGRDGDWASAALEAIGCTVVRGSSRRGGTGALIRLIRTRENQPRPAGLVVDGPLGPVGEAKPGIAFCALRTGRPLRAVGTAASRSIVFRKAWSRIYLPLPFSRVTIFCDDPIAMGDSHGPEAVRELTLAIDRRLAIARARAIAMLKDADLRQASPADIHA